MPNTLDINFTITSAELIPYSRSSLLFGIQNTVMAEYSDILLLSQQDLNKDVDAIIHSGHDEKNLYIQFRMGEKQDDTRKSLSPESLIQLAASS